MGKNLTGFILLYETVNNAESKSFVQTPPAKFNYFRENDLSQILFIVPPQNNYFPSPQFPIIYLENTRQSQSTNVNIRIYHFNRSSDMQLWNAVDE